MGILRSNFPRCRRFSRGPSVAVAVLALVTAGCGESMVGPDEDGAIDERILLARSSAGDAHPPYDLGWIAPDGSGFESLGIVLRSALIGVTPDRRRAALMTADFTIQTMNADGSGLATLSAPSGVGRPMWSPDGTLISFQDADAVYVIPSGGGDAVDVSTQVTASDGVCPNTGRTVLRSFGFAGDGRVMFNNYVCGVGDHFYRVSADGVHASPHSREDYDPEVTYWSPDGSRILSEAGGTVFVMNADGSGRRTLQEAGGSLPSRFWDRGNPWSPDGSRVAFISVVHHGGEPARGITVMEVDGEGSTQFAVPPGASPHLSWSPSGEWIAFRVLHNGAYDVFVADSEGLAVTNLTNSPDSYHLPVWVRLN